MQIYNSYETLPRPESWMPGPPSPWSNLPADDRTLSKQSLVELLDKIKTQNENVEVEHQNQDLPQEAIEHLGDNDIVSKPSAVLAPLVLSDDGKNIASIIIMTRTTTVSTHKGQVSFPGGMVEDTDASLEETALRETYEEVGVAPENFTVIGRSNPVATRTQGSHIMPIVALCEQEILEKISINTDEVASIHNIAIEELLKPDNYFCEIWDFGEIAAPIHMYFVHDDKGKKVFIWGATAHMITELLHCSTDNALL